MRPRLTTDRLAAACAIAAALLAVWNLTRPPAADRYGLLVLAILCVLIGMMLVPEGRRRLMRAFERLGTIDQAQAEIDDYIRRSNAQRASDAQSRGVH